ncbi:MAG: glycerophosphodiester phosphodiesterase, partial [Clostridiales bacterium]|nr:glycerophosphodiester phosphodiesterase [Candidatus Apopatousia equi]
MEKERNIYDSWVCNRVIAHRGLHNETLPENSLGAFENAVKNNYPVELDVRLISDGTVIVLHDDNLNRACGKDKYASSLKKEELKDCKLFGTEYTIPTFEEVLKVIGGKVPMLIEFKQNEGKIGELETKVYDMLKNYKGEYAIESFNPFTLEWFKQHAPHIFRGQLSCFFKGEKLSLVKKILLKKLKLNKISRPDFIAYKFDELPNKWVKKYEKLGIPVLAWT